MRSLFFAAPVLSVVVFVAMIATGWSLAWSVVGFFISGTGLVLIAALLGYGASKLTPTAKNGGTQSDTADREVSS